MRKFTKTMAAVLSLSMTLTMGTPVFAEEPRTTVTPVTTVVEAPGYTNTCAGKQPPKTGVLQKRVKPIITKMANL